MIIAYLAAFLAPCHAINFIATINSKELRCYGENIAQNILFAGQVDSNSTDYSFKIHVPAKKHDNILTYSHSTKTTQFSFTTNNTQYNYQFCVHNLGSLPLQFNFTLNTGLEAQDYTLLAQKEDLKPLEYSLKKLNGLISAVDNHQKSIEEMQASRIHSINSMSFKILIFSCGTLALMILTNFFQAQRVKYCFKLKKLI